MQITFSTEATSTIIENVIAMRRAHERYTDAMQRGSDAWADLFEEYRKAAALVGMTIDNELEIMDFDIPIWQETE